MRRVSIGDGRLNYITIVWPALRTSFFFEMGSTPLAAAAASTHIAPHTHHHHTNPHPTTPTKHARRGHPTAAAGAAAMANASMRAAAAQYINPAPKLSHQATVVRLYRQSLKTLGSWCVAL